MHRQAALAAEAALAAHAQGKFFEMQEALFANLRALSRPKMEELAQGLGLDMDRFRADLDGGVHKARVEAETREVMAVGTTGTPASFINGRYLRGAAPFDKFKAIIDEELKWHRDGGRPQFVLGKNIRETQPARPPQRRRGPDPAQKYDIPVGGAPYEGAENAKITILHYLDYQ